MVIDPGLAVVQVERELSEEVASFYIASFPKRGSWSRSSSKLSRADQHAEYVCVRRMRKVDATICQCMNRE